MVTNPRIAIVGPGRAGKDTAAEYLAATTPLRMWGSTSKVILPYAAQWLGVSEDEAWETRHQDRALWRRIGDELRRDDPAALARVTLEHGDINVGVRARVEIEAVIRECLVDMILWIARDVPWDPTLEFGPGVADLVINNNGTIADLYRKLDGMAAAMGIRKEILA